MDAPDCSNSWRAAGSGRARDPSRGREGCARARRDDVENLQEVAVEAAPEVWHRRPTTLPTRRRRKASGHRAGSLRKDECGSPACRGSRACFLGLNRRRHRRNDRGEREVRGVWHAGHRSYFIERGEGRVNIRRSRALPARAFVRLQRRQGGLKTLARSAHGRGRRASERHISVVCPGS